MRGSSRILRDGARRARGWWAVPLSVAMCGTTALALGVPSAGAVPSRLATSAVPHVRPTGRTAPSDTYDVGSTVPVAASASAGGRGLWIVSTDAGVTDEGDAPHDSGVVDRLSEPTVDMASTPSGKGYWLLTSDGGVHPFGTAGHYRGAIGDRLTEQVVGLAPSVGGRGYWIFTRDGQVVPRGSAVFHGSAYAEKVVSPIAAMAAQPDGRGYWLVARNGRLMPFGSAAFYGSPRHQTTSSPVVAMTPTPDGRGYWVLERSGRVYAYGNASAFGSAPSPAAPAYGLVASAGGRGYWILLDNGQVVPFGAARNVHTTRVTSTGDSLVGQIVTLDPGHNGDNYTDPAYIDHLVPSGPDGMEKACDTAGTETDAGYTEAAFNFDVVTRTTALLRAQGATVVQTRYDNTGIGPCINIRAAIGNDAHSDVALSVHADGGPPNGRGFCILEPQLFPGYNDAVVPPSDRLGTVLRNEVVSSGLLPVSTYYGTDGIEVRSDLGGLNLSTVPKVFIETGNMRDATDAALQTNPNFRQSAAGVIAEGLTQYLTTVP